MLWRKHLFQNKIAANQTGELKNQRDLDNCSCQLSIRIFMDFKPTRQFFGQHVSISHPEAKYDARWLEVVATSYSQSDYPSLPP